MSKRVTIRFVRDYEDVETLDVWYKGEQPSLLDWQSQKYIDAGCAVKVDQGNERIRPDSPMTWNQLFGQKDLQQILDFDKISVASPSETSDNSLMGHDAFTSENTLAVLPAFNPALITFNPTPQQVTVFEAVEDLNGPHHMVVMARAGTGKTTTLIGCFRRILAQGKRVLFLAFNKKIRREIERKVRKEFTEAQQKFVKIATFHSYGMGIWMKANEGCKVEGDNVAKGQAGYWKFDRILEELEPIHGQLPYMYKKFVKSAWTYARQALFGYKVNLMDKSAWLKLVDRFDLDECIAEVAEDDGIYLTTDELQEHVGQALNWTVRVIRQGIKIAHEIIDFEDMIYMILVSQVRVWQQDFVLVDEAQDTNSSRREFVAKLLKPTGRSVWVGDDYQAIYAFTGADNDSLTIIQKRFSAVELPLTVSFRCSRAAIRKAQKWCPDIEAHETAIEGEDRTINVEDILKENLTENDVIICRNNKPLMTMALQLIRRGIACHIEGRDIGEKIMKLVTRWKSIHTIDQLRNKLERYLAHEIEKLMARGKENAASFIADEVETLTSLIDDMPVGSTLRNLEQKLKDMFLNSEDEPKPTLTLCSSHKSKGLEWERVFWLGYNVYNPSKYARKEADQEQEKHLMYVTVTRTKNAIVSVTVPSRGGFILRTPRKEQEVA